MTDQGYIRKAVELADEFEMHHNDEGFVRYFDKDQHNFISFYFGSDYKDELQFGLDALAAQLVRQVDASEAQIVFADEYTDCHSDTHGARRYTAGRTMNTIKAIVDSKVLE